MQRVIGERAPEAANPKLMQPLPPNRMQVIYANFFADYAKTNVNYHYDMADNAKTNGMLWHDQLCQFTRWMQCLQLNSRRRTVMERGERVIGMRPV